MSEHVDLHPDFICAAPRRRSQAERRELNGRAGRLELLCGRLGPPLLLIHSINAAGSAYEVRPIFEHSRDAGASMPWICLDTASRTVAARLRRPACSSTRCMTCWTRSPPMSAPDPWTRWRSRCRSSSWRGRRPNGRNGSRTVALVTPDRLLTHLSHTMRGPSRATREVPGLYRFFTFPVWSKGLLRPAGEQA